MNNQHQFSLIFTAYKTIIYYELNRFIRIWSQTLTPSAITMALYFIVFGQLIGSRIAPVHGLSYINYIAPGLIMMAIITNSYENVAGSFFSIRFQRSIEELLIAPVPSFIIILGFMSGGMLRGCIVGCIVTVIASLFVSITIKHIVILMLTVFLTTALFAFAGLFNAIFARRFDDISFVPVFILTPLTYFGGVFYSIDMLHPFWQKLSLFNPILYIVNAFRYAMLGISDVSITLAMFILALLMVLIFILNLYLLDKSTRIRG